MNHPKHSAALLEEFYIFSFVPGAKLKKDCLWYNNAFIVIPPWTVVLLYFCLITQVIGNLICLITMAKYTRQIV